MTNEVVVAGATVGEQISSGLGQQAEAQREVVQRVMEWLATNGISFAFDVLSAILILLFGWIATKIIVALVGRAVERGRAKNTLLAGFVRNVVSKTCWAILLVVVLGKLGVNVGPIVAGLGVTGFILGFAFQESLGNLASGLMIAINEPFKIGDYVIVAGNEGTVLKVDMMATELATADNKKVIIPNKSAWGGPIVNFSALGRRRVDLSVALAYSSDVAKAINVALEALKAVPGVLTDPAPGVSVAALDNCRVTLNVRPWVEGANYWDVFNAAQIAVKVALEKNGVAAPIPQMNVRSI